MSRKAEFLSTIKPILDKKEAKQDAIELARELSDVLGEIDIGADGSGFNELKEIFNAQLVEMGKQPIVFSESTLKGITAQFANAVSEGIKVGVAEGSSAIESGIMAQLDALNKRKNALRAEAESIIKKYEKLEHYSEMSSLDVDEDIKPLRFDGGDIDEQALSLMEGFTAAEDALSSLKKGTQEYEQALIEAVEAGEKLFQMRLTLEKNKGSVRDSYILEDYKLTNLSDITSDVFDTAESYFTKKLRTWDFRGESKKIAGEIEAIDKQIDDLQKNNADIFQQEQAKRALKTLQEVEEAYGRIATKKGAIKKVPAQNLQIALGQEEETRTLTQLRNDYNKVKDTGNWEDVYTAIARFVNKFESELQAGNISQDRLPEYTKLYDQFTPIIGSVRSTLDSLANYAKGVVSAPTGAGSNYVPQQTVNDAQKKADANDTSADAAEREANALGAQGAALHENLELLRKFEGAKERSVWYDSKTGRYSEIKTGDDHAVTTSMDEVRRMSQSFDTGVHSHSYNVAAPSILGKDNDFDTWIKAIDYIKQRAIVAREEILSFDFSSLTKDDLQNITAQYKEVATSIMQDVDQIIANGKIGEEFGTLHNLEEALQVRLREALEHIMQQFPGVMSSNKISLGGGRNILTSKQKADEATRNIQTHDDVNTRRTELSKQLDSYDGDVLDSQTADEYLGKRKEIFELLQKENLLTDEIKNKYDLINNRLETRADLLREAESYYDDVDDLLTGQRVDSIDSAEQYRKDHIQTFDNVIDRMRDSGFFSESEIEDNFIAISNAMERRASDIAAKSVFDELDKNLVDPDTINDVEQLNKILAKRNSLLNSVDDISLIDYDHNAYADALKHNQLIEDRIAMLQKAQSLLPNADNFNQNSFMDEAQKAEVLKLGEEYRTIMTLLERDDAEISEIADALRERARAIMDVMHKVKGPDGTPADSYKMWFGGSDEAATAIGSVNKQSALNMHQFDKRRITNESRQAAIDLIYKEIEAQKQLAEARKAAKEAERQQEIDNFVSKYESATTEEKKLVNDLTGLWQESQRLHELEDDDSMRAYNQVVADRYEVSDKLKAANRELYEAFYDVNPKEVAKHIKPIDTGNIGGASSAEVDNLRQQLDAKVSITIEELKGLLESVTFNVKDASDKPENTENVTQGPWALEQTLNTTIKNLLENIRQNTSKIGDPDAQQIDASKIAEVLSHMGPQVTDVGNVLATEGTLSAIKTAVESINNKTVKGARVGSGAGHKSTTKSDYQGSPFFSEKLKTREMELAKFAQKLMNEGQDTAKMQDAVKQLRDALKLVNSGEKLSVWDQKFRQAKLAVGIDELKEKPDEKESVQTYKNLIAYAKEYYSIVEKHEKAKENTQRKAILAQQKQDAETFMRDGGLNLDTLELGDEAYNKKLSDLRAKHKRNLEVINADKSDTTNSQQIKKESDALETLLGLYKEYGSLDAKWNYSDGKNEAIEQERQMLDVYKKIQEQKASMGIADDDTRYDEQITKAWEQGFKDIENTKREARAKASDRDETKRIQDEVKSVEKYVKELGALEAELQFASGTKETDELNRQIEQKKRYIDLKKQELQLDEKDLLIQQTKSYQDKYNSLSLKDSKAQDKTDDAATIKRNNEAYERLIKLRREQYDIEKKLFNVEKGSKLEATYTSQLADIKNLIAHQKTLVHYNAKYEQQLTDMANAHSRNKERWESGRVDNTKAKALATEREEVEKLADAYKLLGKLIAERNYATLPEEKDAIQAIINKHVKDIKANQYNTSNRLDMLRGVARAEQVKAEERLSRKAAKQTGTERLRQEAKTENEALAKQKQIVTNLISLYKQLGQAKARQNTSLFSDEQVAQAHVEDAQIRRLIKAERAKLSSVDYDTDMRFKGAKAEGYRIATTNAERAAAGKATSQRMREETKAENDALKEQKQIVTDLVALYKQLGQAEAKRDMTSQNSAEAVIADKEVQNINDQIDAKRKLIKVNNELENQFADSWMSGIESETKKPIQDLGKEYEKLGKLRVEVDKTPDGDYLVFLKKQLATQQKLVNTESRRLDISDDLRASYDQKADNAYNNKVIELEKKAAKERDKIREQERAEAFKQQERDLKRQVKESQELSKVNKAKSAINKADDVLVSALHIEGLTDEQIAKLNAYNVQLTKLKTQYNEVRNSDGIVSEKQRNELIDQTNSVNKFTQEINELVAEYNRLSGDNVTILGASALGDNATLDDYKKQLTDMVMAYTNGKASITGFNAATKELSYTVQTGKYEFVEYTAAARHLDNQFVTLQGNTKKLETPMEKLKRKMSEILTYFGGSSLIYEFFGQFRQGIQYVREIDSALTELKKVTDETEESYDRFLDTAAKTADKVGSTITNIVSSTADWARLGYSMEDAAQLAESTSVLLNVSEFSSIEDATSALTSTMQAFGYVAEDSMHVVDILNEVGKLVARR